MTGGQIYGAQCVRCHGEQGRGTDEYADPLEGDLSVAQLAEQIRVTMPEDDPGSLSADEARAVAEHVHDEFYSAIARARTEVPRIALSRLTVRQYRNTVADVVGSFRWQPTWGDQRGLRGEYFPGRHLGGDGERAADRVDSQIAFDFGTSVPVEEIKDAKNFSIRWTGSLWANDTGWHEFVVRTEHALRLWVNDNKTPVVDAWVKSGDDTEYTARIFLLGGRPYPLRLEFSRGNQGVTDEKLHDQFEQVQPAAITLLWRPPHGALEPVPRRVLSPAASPEVLACATPFPADDRSYGWERGTTVSQAWDEATTQAAVEVADYIDAHLDELAQTNATAGDRSQKLQAFCTKLAERAFRGPLVDETRTAYVDRSFSDADEPAMAVRRSVLAVLKSPRFLYRELDRSNPAALRATRLAYTLWDAPPSVDLMQSAREQKLDSSDQLVATATQMLADPRGRAKLRDFLVTWLHVDGEVNIAKDAELFPQFDQQMVADLRTSLEVMLDTIAWSDAADYRQLFLANSVFLNQRLAAFYGASTAVADPGEFTPVVLNEGQRAGVLTHPYVMARFAYNDQTSPIHRGVFLARGVLGQVLKPPPEAIAPAAADLQPDLTTRERVALQTSPPACMTCHHMINPLGFTLEKFDAVGRFREVERDRPIDDDGFYQPRDGARVELADARHLAEFLSQSDEVSRAFTQQMFHYLVQQSIAAYGVDTLEVLHRKFVANNYNIRQLAVDIAVVATERSQ